MGSHSSIVFVLWAPSLWLRREFIATIRTAIRILEPLLQAAVAKYMLTLGQTYGVFDEAVRIFDTELVVTYDTA
jgi:hypothetical protein